MRNFEKQKEEKEKTSLPREFIDTFSNIQKWSHVQHKFRIDSDYESWTTSSLGTGHFYRSNCKCEITSQGGINLDKACGLTDNRKL